MSMAAMEERWLDPDIEVLSDYSETPFEKEKSPMAATMRRRRSAMTSRNKYYTNSLSVTEGNVNG